MERSDAINYRARVTGHLLSRFISGRVDDYRAMRRGLLYQVRDLPEVIEYTLSRAQGHLTPVFPEDA